MLSTNIVVALLLIAVIPTSVFMSVRSAALSRMLLSYYQLSTLAEDHNLGYAVEARRHLCQCIYVHMHDCTNVARFCLLFARHTMCCMYVVCLLVLASAAAAAASIDKRGRIQL